MGFSSRNFALTDADTEVTYTIELTRGYLVGVGVVCTTIGLDVLDFRAIVALTESPFGTQNVIVPLCQGQVGRRSWLSWTGRLLIPGNTGLTIWAQGYNLGVGRFSCIVEEA
jgi:hypothetical protein